MLWMIICACFFLPGTVYAADEDTSLYRCTDFPIKLCLSNKDNDIDDVNGNDLNLRLCDFVLPLEVGEHFYCPSEEHTAYCGLAMDIESPDPYDYCSMLGTNSVFNSRENRCEKKAQQTNEEWEDNAAFGNPSLG